MSKEERQVLVIKENENYTSQKHYKCQQKLENIYNTEGNVIRSWKYCPNCKPKATATQKKGDKLL